MTTFTVEFGKQNIPVRLEWNEKGLKKISLLATKVKKQSPEKTLPQEIDSLMTQLELYFSGKLKQFNFDWLDFSQISEFQRKVYRAARQIPFGKTKTYAEVASAIGHPKAVRAVGTALGKNPWILLVPCHRVKSKTGLGGFSAPGGIKTKQQLLTLES
jgi:O-6-methylguanine DNA methyltransferase